MLRMQRGLEHGLSPMGRQLQKRDCPGRTRRSCRTLFHLRGPHCLEPLRLWCGHERGLRVGACAAWSCLKPPQGRFWGLEGLKLKDVISDFAAFGFRIQASRLRFFALFLLAASCKFCLPNRPHHVALRMTGTDVLVFDHTVAARLLSDFITRRSIGVSALAMLMCPLWLQKHVAPVLLHPH